MTYVESIKDRINSFRTKNMDDLTAEKIKNDPQYKAALVKLEELYIRRANIMGQLEKVELDIDACLLLVAMNEKKEEINSRPDMARPNKI